jgi:hypothetical protein
VALVETIYKDGMTSGNPIGRGFGATRQTTNSSTPRGALGEDADGVHFVYPILRNIPTLLEEQSASYIGSQAEPRNQGITSVYNAVGGCDG